MKRLAIILTLILFTFSSCFKINNSFPTVNNEENSSNSIDEQDSIIRGADLSFLPRIESYGTIFRDSTGSVMDPLKIFKDNGCNTIRLRLWYHSSTGHSGFSEVKAFSQTIHDAGMKVMLDIHYSDTWADPGAQTKPASWADLGTADLEDSVYQYTKRVVESIQPEYVQIGNEINGGFLWDDGRIGNRSTFTTLLKKAIQGCRDADSSTKTIIHFAGYKGALGFYRILQSYQVNYDIIGISYYTWWHGTDMDAMADSLKILTSTFDKSVVIAETAYPFTLGWNDNYTNIVGSKSTLISKYPPTPQGQKEFLLGLKSVMSKNSKYLGFCYWEPDWIAFKGPQATDGSSWENLALFDFNNKALPAMAAYNK